MNGAGPGGRDTECLDSTTGGALVETYLTTRKPTRHHPRMGGTDWGQVLKWFVLAFLVLQLFWWLAPALSRLQF